MHPLSSIAVVALLVPAQVAPSRPLPIEGARTVLAAVVRAAEQKSLQDDALTEHYYRVAARTALQLPEDQRANALLLAMGIGLDESELMRKNPVTRELWRKIEPDADRARRLPVLGTPTMRGRHDLAQHFAVSGALTAMSGAKLAESAGILKEQLDMQPGGSGFSFVDLLADLAGIAFANHLQRDPKRLDKLSGSFRVIDFLPAFQGLREGLSREEFTRDFGTVSEERFRKELDALRKRVDSLPVYPVPK